MIATLLTLLQSLFWATGKIFEFLYSKQLVDAGRTMQELDNLKGQVDAARIALAAREAVRAADAKRSGGVSIDERDPFLRD